MSANPGLTWSRWAWRSSIFCLFCRTSVSLGTVQLAVADRLLFVFGTDTVWLCNTFCISNWFCNQIWYTSGMFLSDGWLREDQPTCRKLSTFSFLASFTLFLSLLLSNEAELNKCICCISWSIWRNLLSELFLDIPECSSTLSAMLAARERQFAPRSQGTTSTAAVSLMFLDRLQ